MSEWDESVDEIEAVDCETTEVPVEQADLHLAPQPGEQAQPGAQARCEVTGRMVHPDDLVEFQGKMVSAAGKRILLRQLMGGESDKNAIVKPSFVRRALCAMMDRVILFIVALVGSASCTCLTLGAAIPAP